MPARIIKQRLFPESRKLLLLVFWQFFSGGNHSTQAVDNHCIAFLCNVVFAHESSMIPYRHETPGEHDKHVARFITIASHSDTSQVLTCERRMPADVAMRKEYIPWDT